MSHVSMKYSTLSLAIALATLAPAAIAQDGQAVSPSQASQATTLDAVQVTARRRSESIQDVPVAVTAFGEEQLKDLQASNID